ncbi:MAG TPA: hypothetical protein VJ227_02285 [Patescibacteria group bacterium]|nr:hypothetical protein [Patescibacteria group bacterium]
MEIDRDRIKEASADFRRRGWIGDEKLLLLALAGWVYFRNPELANLRGEPAQALVDSIIEVNQDLLPKMFSVVQERRKEREEAASA